MASYQFGRHVLDQIFILLVWKPLAAAYKSKGILRFLLKVHNPENGTSFTDICARLSSLNFFWLVAVTFRKRNRLKINPHNLPLSKSVSPQKAERKEKDPNFLTSCCHTFFLLWQTFVKLKLPSKESFMSLLKVVMWAKVIFTWIWRTRKITFHFLREWYIGNIWKMWNHNLMEEWICVSDKFT